MPLSLPGHRLKCRLNCLRVAYLSIVILTSLSPFTSIFNPFIPAASADTEVSGGITTDTTWTATGSPYIVTGDVTVGKDKTTLATLTIEPGVMVKFNPGTQLKVGYFHSSIAYKRGALSASGTAEAPITFTSAQATPQPGDWQGLNFTQVTGDASTILDHCIIEYGGDTLGANVYIDNASPTITNCSVRFGSGDGIKVYGLNVSGASNPLIGGTGAGNTIVSNNGSGINCTASCGLPIVEYNTISDNGGFAIRIPSYMNSVSGNTGSGNGFDKIQLLGDRIRYSCEWKLNDFPYYTTEFIEVMHNDRKADTAKLTIDAGVEIQFSGDGGLKISDYNSYQYYWFGAIEARGTDEAPIRFTSASSNPQPGDWKGIYFDRATKDATSIMEHCIVEYGGNGLEGNIYFNDASPTILSSTVRYSSTHGMLMRNNADPIIGAEGSGNTISNNTGYGIYCDDIYTDSRKEGPEPTISHNVISDNGGSAIRIRPGKTTVVNNTGSGNAVDAITFVPAGIRYDSTWYKNDFPYLVETNLTVRYYKKRVANSALLTIKPGVVVEFAPDAKLSIGYYYSRYSWYRGALSIQGTKDEPVLFTSNQPDPAPGDWAGVYLNVKTDVARSRIRHSIIEYGGGSDKGNIHFSEIAVPVEKSVIRKSSSSGIRYTGNIADGKTVKLCIIEDNVSGIYSDVVHPPLVKYNRIQNNQTAGIFNNKDIEFNGDGTDVFVNAPYNWWGSVSGPFGAGDAVIGLVSVDPFALDPEDLDRDNVWDPYELDFYANLDVINIAPDNDHDEMKDDWEYRYGLDLAMNDAYLDLDGDGYFNIVEYRFSNIPSDAVDTPDIGVHYEYDALGRITRIYRFR